MRGLSLFGFLAGMASLLRAADGYVSRADVSRAEVSRADVSKARAALGRLPLRFEENRGQFDPAVRYAARSGGYTLQLSASGAALAMAGGERIEMGLVNSNTPSKIEALDRLPTRTEYFLGNQDR